MTRLLCWVFAAGAVLAGPAFAATGDPVKAADAPVATASSATDANITSFLNDGEPADDGGPAPAGGAAGPNGPVKRQIHGEVGATIGTGGYHDVYGVVNIPIGKTGSATIAVSQGRSRYGGYGYGYGGYGAYGYGGFGYGAARPAYGADRGPLGASAAESAESRPSICACRSRQVVSAQCDDILAKQRSAGWTPELSCRP